MSIVQQSYACQTNHYTPNPLATFIGEMMTQEGGWDGGGMGRGIRFRINGQISALYPPQLSISERSFCEKYVRLAEVELEGLVSILNCIRIILPARQTLPQNCITLI